MTTLRAQSKRALIRIIRGYQVVRANKQSPCRFWPSCSQYAVEAIELHGPVRGGWLALRRLGRCRPFGPHGVDPVPEPKHRHDHGPLERRDRAAAMGGA